MKTEKTSLTYSLYSTERIYRKDTLISFYFRPNIEYKREWFPVDVNGERLRENRVTGEVTTYTKKQILNSRAVSLRRTVIAMNMLLSMNDFDWFWTLTFDKDKIDRTNAEEVFNCYKKYINNLKHKYPSFKYMTFPEQHEDGNFHFHLLVAGLSLQQMGLVDSGKVCCHWATKKNGVASKTYFENSKVYHELKETDGEPIYNVTSFCYGYTTASRICSRERCNTYVKKYVQKALGSTDIFKKRFYYSSNLNVPDIVKRLIGDDFDTPQVLDKFEPVSNSPYVKNALCKPYLANYNVLQVKIENKIKKLIEDGFIPVGYADIFDNQISMSL